MRARIPRCRRWASPRLLLISFNKPAKKTFPGPSSIKNFHPRSASRCMVHILGRCYPPGVKIHYLFAALEATGLATVRKSKWHYVPIGSNGCADQPPRLLEFQGHTGGYSALWYTSLNFLCCALNASTTNGRPWSSSIKAREKSTVERNQT
jgi:hypothetical protein